jgi:hypothetical protein
MFDETRYVWRYILGGTRKHAFYRQGGIPRHRAARCGTAPQWFDPIGWLGAHGDEVAKLAALKPCGRCVDNLKRDTVAK